MTLPIVSVPMIPSRFNESAAASRRPLGRGDDLLGRVGQAVGRDDLAPALLDELLAQLDVGSFEPDDQGDAEIELVVGRQERGRRSCRTS